MPTPKNRFPSSIRLIALATVAVLALLGLQSANASTNAPTTKAAAAGAVAPLTGKHGAKPTIVLVHGAWADSSSWTKVTMRLQNQGYDVFVPPNPLRGLTGDAAYIRDFLSTITGPIVLVGHSYGGAVITNAATGNPNIVALVYVDAFAPDDGEVILNLAGEDSALNAPPETVFDFRPYPGAPAGDADLYLKKNVFLTNFAPDVPIRERLAMYAGQKPAPFSGLATASGPPAWEDIPSWYLLGTQDQIITPDAQLAMAERAGSHIKRVKASHVSMVSHPQAATSLIVQAVGKTS